MTGNTEDRHDSAWLTAILDAAVDAVIVADSGGTIIRINQAASELFGYAHDELVGELVDILMPEPMSHLHAGYIDHYLRTGEKRIIDIGRDVEGQRRDGNAFPMHISVGRADIDGDVMFIAIMHDLTLRRATEAALERSQRLDAIGQMTGGIAHDFNNLLTVMIGNLELLQMRLDDTSLRELADDALEAAELGADLTSRLLSFARKGILKPELIDVSVACNEALSLLRRTIGPKHRIELKLDPDVDQVWLDPARLQSSLVNLVLNARDAMPDGGDLVFTLSNIEIDDSYIAQETNVAEGSYVRLSIRDNGEGMSEEAQRRAFEPFFSTKPPGKGTGLGLAMVYGFVRQSGGHVSIYSEIGHGSEISLYFPANADTHLEHIEPEIVPIRAHGRTILVVEDDAHVRKASVDRLHDLGFETLEAESGDEAFEMLASGAKVDLVFSDVMMPGNLNGYLLADQLSRQFPGIRMLLTSGYAHSSAPGSDDGQRFAMLRKPYRQSDLSRQLQALFDRS